MGKGGRGEHGRREEREDLHKCLLCTNICTNKYCKFTLNYPTCFGVNTQSTENLQMVFDEVMNY